MYTTKPQLLFFNYFIGSRRKENEEEEFGREGKDEEKEVQVGEEN
jgi:hypothetical protein